MKTRGFIFGADFPEICEWWRAYGWQAVPKSRLPSVGFVTHEGELKTGAVWVYASDSKMLFMDFLVLNPKTVGKMKVETVELLVATCREYAKSLGADFIFTTTRSKGLIRQYEKNGFVVTEKEMTNLVMGVS